MIRIAICDDDINYLDKIEEYVIKAGKEGDFEHRIFKSTDAREFLEEFENNFYDIIILDIQMPEINGFDIAKEVNKKSRIIFVSNFDEFVFKSFEYEPIYYVRKCELEKLVEIVKNFYQSNIRKSISFDTPEMATIRLDYDDIVYIEVVKNYIRINAVNGDSFIVRGPLKNIEDKLLDFDFCKINNGMILNLAYIDKIEENEVYLNKICGNVRLCVARSRLKELKVKFFKKGIRNVKNI